VLETVQKTDRTQRRRSCVVCGHRFTTREQAHDVSLQRAEDAVPEWLKKAARRGQRLDEDAIMAAIRTDRRRDQIRQQRIESERKEREALRDAGFDDSYDSLTDEQLRRELEGY
jgi:transcriptional regulator NrdR family protein